MASVAARIRGFRAAVPTHHDVVTVFKDRLIYGIWTALVISPYPTEAFGFGLGGSGASNNSTTTHRASET